MGVRDEPSGVRVALLALMEDCRDKESSSEIRKKKRWEEELRWRQSIFYASNFCFHLLVSEDI